MYKIHTQKTAENVAVQTPYNSYIISGAVRAWVYKLIQQYSCPESYDKSNKWQAMRGMALSHYSLQNDSHKEMTQIWCQFLQSNLQTNKHGKTIVMCREPQDPTAVIGFACKTEYPLETVEWNQTQLKVSENSSAIKTITCLKSQLIINLYF